MPSVRRLTAILAADVVGYSRLMGADEEGTHERLQAHLRDLIEAKIAEHRGQVVKNTGDGFLAAFASVVDAVRCAVEMQRGMAERNTGTPPEKRIEFRVGINLGDVIAEAEDIFGDGVNVAARLEELAEPGRICVSGTCASTYATSCTIHSRIGASKTSRTSHARCGSMRCAPRPSLICRRRACRSRLRVDGALPLLRWRQQRRSSSALARVAFARDEIPSRADGGGRDRRYPNRTGGRCTALIDRRAPLRNLGNDPEQQYFADGITDDLTTDLSRIAHAFVISRNTAFTYRNKAVTTKQIGRELGVRHVLEGSVRRSGNQVRVNVQLIDAETSAHLWAERFDSDLGDLFVLQNAITSRLANALNLRLTEVEAARPTDHPDAIDYIFRGHAALNKGAAPDNFAQAIDLFEHALAMDPGSLKAQSSLAVTLVSRVLTGMTHHAVPISHVLKV